MLFNSIPFLIFLPIVFFIYWKFLGNKLIHQNIFILIASYFFYAWWSWKFLILLFISTLIDFLYGFGVASESKIKSKIFLTLSIINNLLILGIFKYYNFFATELKTLLSSFSIQINPILLNVALPVGISFYTFHGMSYVFDIYKKERQPVKIFSDYAVFVSFFPLLVAGPIERASHLLPQIEKKREFNYLQAIQGCRLILWGLFKKVVIADNISGTVDQIMNNFQAYNSLTLIIGAIGFTFQIYCDFSGYTDVALGVAKLFGFELLSNFNFPLFSRDIGEYWARWHISLSSWFRDYLYYPLGGFSKGKLTAVKNTIIIFLVSGFWHGASWNFIIWGAIHAFAFIPILFFNKDRTNVSIVVANGNYFPNYKEIIQILFTFLYVTFALVFFRIQNVFNAIEYILKPIFVFFNNPIIFLQKPTIGFSIFIYIFPFVLIDWYLRENERVLKVPKNKILRYLIYIIMILLIYSSFTKSPNSFIYFQF